MMKSILLLLVLAIVQQQSVVQADVSFTRSASTDTGRRRMLRSRSSSAAAVTAAEPAERLLQEDEEDDYEPDVFMGNGCDQTDEDGDELGAEDDCEILEQVKCQEDGESDCLPKCTEGQEPYDENKVAQCYESQA